tara:strand:+ start:6431 stop:7828 length:1398 start_codon:yes stop_codon:yes gene_type:complete
MGLFSFGRSKSKSSSNSASNTYVDPSQQRYLNDLRNQAQNLNRQGMPVEGVAGINPNLAGALQNQYMGGNMQASAGTGLMGSGSALAGGSMSALNFANQAMGGQVGMPQMQTQGPESLMNKFQTQGPESLMNTGGYSPRGGGAINTAFGAGNAYAGGVAQGGVAQGSGVDFGMAGNMANSASTADAANMNAAVNQGFNQNNLSNYINNDVLQGQIDAASRDVVRNLNENELLANRSTRAGSGGSGNSRGAIMDAIATGRAKDRISDISTAIRAPAYMQGVGIEAGRANQNAAFQQAANQANAGFNQQANQFNAGAQNRLLGQGFGIGASQLQGNLQREQQGNQFNAGQYNTGRQFGTGVGQNAFNTNQQNQQFGASLAARLGAQGTSDMRAGANMFNTGVGQQLASGQYGRDFEQQLYNQQFRQGMAPFNALNFYNQIVGAPNNLSSATSSSKGSSKSMNLGFGF